MLSVNALFSPRPVFGVDEVGHNYVNAGGVRTTTAMHCGFKIFKMAAKVEKFRRLYALFFNRYSSFLR